MLNQKLFGLPMWVFIVILSIVLISVYKTSNSIEEKFAEIPSEQNNKIKVFNFNTSWCGWSKRFQPEWDNFQQETKSNPLLTNIEAHDIKCDMDENNSMCEKYQVPGYPYVVIEDSNGVRQYNGPRTKDALVKEFSK